MKKIFTLIATALFVLGANAQSTDVVDLSAETLDTENSINTSWCFKGTDITIIPDGGRDVKIVYCPEGSTAETGGYGALNVKNNTKQTIKLPDGTKLYRIQITGFSQGDNFDYIYAWGAGDAADGYEWTDPIGTGIKDNAVINSQAAYPIDPCGFKGTRVAESTRECGYIIADIDFGNDPYEGAFDLICNGNNQADLNYKLFLSREAADAAGSGSSETVIGAEDNSVNFWTAFSDYYTLKPNQKITFNFTNYSSMVENFHNWVLVVSTAAERGADGYSEYFALRPDFWAWQYALTREDPSWYTSITLSDGWDWDNFRTNMNESEVELVVERQGKTVTATATMTAKNGTVYVETFVIDCGDGTQNINAFLTCEKAHLVLKSAVIADVTPTGINSVKAAAENDGAIYNIAGQKVSKDYKGLVIKNGKKMIQK